jgi:hypothetical protein
MSKGNIEQQLLQARVRIDDEEQEQVSQPEVGVRGASVRPTYNASAR